MYSGYATISETVKGNLNLILDIQKCDFSMKSCDKYSTRNIPGICALVQLKDALFAEAFVNVVPKVECPLKPANYSLGTSAIDMKPFSLVQLDGFIWIVNFRLMSAVDGNSKRKTALCVNSQTKVVRVKSKTL